MPPWDDENLPLDDCSDERLLGLASPDQLCSLQRHADSPFSGPDFEAGFVASTSKFVLRFAYVFTEDNCSYNKINNIANTTQASFVNVYKKL